MATPVPTGAAIHLWGSIANESYVADVAVAAAHARVEHAPAAVRAVDVEPDAALAGDPASPGSGSMTSGVHVAGAAHDGHRRPPRREVLVDGRAAGGGRGRSVPAPSSGIVRRLPRPIPSTPSARPTTWCVSGWRRRAAPGALDAVCEGRRPRRSPACCRAAPMPTRLAVEPPAVKVSTTRPGAEQLDQPAARRWSSPAGCPACSHQRWGRRPPGPGAAAAIVVGAVVTQSAEARAAQTAARRDDLVLQGLEHAHNSSACSGSGCFC